MGRPSNCRCCGTNGGGAGDICYGITTNISLINASEVSAIQSNDKIILAGRTGLDLISNDIALVRYNNNGSLDTSFGIGGITITDVTNANFHSEKITSILIQTDGKIIVAGLTKNTTLNAPISLFLIRYNANGTIDTTFGINGKITITSNIPSNFPFNTVRVLLASQADGKILVATNDVINNKIAVKLLRIDSNGSIDSNFGSSLFFDVDNYVGSIIITGNKILIAGHSRPSNGFFLARYNGDGSLDTSFGSTINSGGSGGGGFNIGGGGGNLNETFGYVLTTFGLSNTGTPFVSEEVRNIIIDNDGKIVVGGMVSENLIRKIALIRYFSDGNLDTSFNNSGKLVTTTGNASSVAGIAKTIDNKIIVAGSTISTLNNSSIQVFYIARFNNDGSFDTSFNTNGVVIRICNSDAVCTAIKIQSDEKILLSGYNSIDFVIVRYNSDGTIDSSFNGV